VALGAGSTAPSRGLVRVAGFWEVSRRGQSWLCEGPGSPRDSPQGGRKSPAGDRGTAGLSKGGAAAFERFLSQEAGQWGHLQTQGHHCGCLLQK